jgi:spore coat polysaccharide biosynthesis protein SpsF
MKVTATIQARMGSTRFPGKVLRTIVGRPVLALIVERIQQSRLIDDIVIATPASAENDAIEQLTRDLGVHCFRGSEEDVLGRVAGALRAFHAELHAEFQGDNLLPDALLIDSTIGYYLKHADEYDYVTNALKTTYPPGVEVTVYPARLLLEIDERATDPGLREHVGPHFYQHPERYRICNLEAPPWLYRPDLHLEIDTQEDFEVVRQVYEHFYPSNPGFSIAEVIAFADRTGIGEHNKNVERRWRAFRHEGA